MSAFSSRRSTKGDLYLYGKEIQSVFELLGKDENDITFSIGWALSQSPHFTSAILSRIFSRPINVNDAAIRLQEYKANGGITDIEIFDNDVHVIIEAKRGWWLPNKKQLLRYYPRFRNIPTEHQALVVMAECSHEFAKRHLPNAIKDVPFHYLNWKDIAGLCKIVRGTHAEKRLLDHLRSYLRRIVKMQKQESNLVYVVSLGSGKPKSSDISWQDIVNKRLRYFHQTEGNGWPKEPPNYLGFRYAGKLQSIHHVESWQVVEGLQEYIPEIKSRLKKGMKLFLYKLGKPIVPTKIIRTGNLYMNGRIWAMLDLLLTCDTISEARDLTKKRQQNDN
jgi:hypothetical protein